jgi:predicted nucleotidyltransferase
MAAIGPLAKRNKGRKIHRTTADRLLADFLLRVKQVNRNEEFAFFVEEVRLFGSYLRGEEMGRDVDVAFSMMRKTMGKLSARCAAIGKHSEDYERAMGEVSDFFGDGHDGWISRPLRILKSMGLPKKLSIRFRVEWT